MNREDGQKRVFFKVCKIFNKISKERLFLFQVVYDTSDFLDTNRDVIPDDVVSVFSRETCQFGFATHLFGNEIK